MSKPYTDEKWYDNPGFVPSLCNECPNWLGRGKCKKYISKIPDEILNKSFPGSEKYDEKYCSYRENK